MGEQRWSRLGMTKEEGISHVLLNRQLQRSSKGMELGKWSSCLDPPYCGEVSYTSDTLQQTQVALGQGPQGVGTLAQIIHPPKRASLSFAVGNDLLKPLGGAPCQVRSSGFASQALKLSCNLSLTFFNLLSFYAAGSIFLSLIIPWKFMIFMLKICGSKSLNLE